MNTRNEMIAKFTADNMKGGMNFENSLEKAFNDYNNFLVEMSNSEMFMSLVFNNVKKIIK